MKVSCKTETPNCMADLIIELEELLLRNDGRKIRLQAINPVFCDERLEFYLKVSKTDSKILYRYSPGIRRYDVKCMTFNELHMPHVFPQDWINLIMPVLDKRFAKNDSTGETEVDLSDLANDTFLSQQGLILKLSNPHVMKHVFNMFKDTNLKTITRLNLSNNEISNLFQLELFFDHCTVLRVDLSNNHLSRVSDLKFMSKNGVVDLNVTSNDFMRKYNSKEIQEEIRKLLPRLTVLNGKTLPATIIIAGDPSESRKSLPESIFSDKSIDVNTEFVAKYCAAFDSITRDALCEFYCPDSVMSLDCYSSDMPSCYRCHNNNIFVTKNNDSSGNIFKLGKASVVGTFATFPRTKHVEETLNVDIAFRTDTDMMFTLTGVFIELPEKGGKTYRPRQFCKTFVIKSGIVLQDHLSLMPTDYNLYQKFKPAIDQIKEQNEFPNKYKEQLKNISAEAVEIVRQFKLFSGMTVKACLEFLSFVSNLEEATSKFTAMKEQGNIPKEAYDGQ